MSFCTHRSTSTHIQTDRRMPRTRNHVHVHIIYAAMGLQCIVKNYVCEINVLMLVYITEIHLHTCINLSCGPLTAVRSFVQSQSFQFLPTTTLAVVQLCGWESWCWGHRYTRCRQLADDSESTAPLGRTRAQLPQQLSTSTASIAEYDAACMMDQIPYLWCRG